MSVGRSDMPEFTVKVYVRRKEGVLDPEGNTIAGAIASIGYKGIS
ncbi:phosphoribosylformylglycinamidine synthase subunit PurS, partial [bacterium]|nr:phosphoribosylformylglycinamidine synthase subunit PurS [bacterium]